MTTNRNQSRQTLRRLAGFTLVELMTVIAILVLLVAILLPAVMKVQQMVRRTTGLSMVRQLGDACRMYNNEMNMFPPSTGSLGGVTLQGKHMLVECLTGYMPAAVDKNEGMGWRLTVGGQKHGPYNGCENMKITGMPESFVDPFANEILYYCFTGTTTSGSFNLADNGVWPNAPKDMNYFKDSNGLWFDGVPKFAIITPGPDGVFTAFTEDRRTDDITSFLQE